MQTTKLKAGKISKISRYDPLDLFSSESGRVCEALCCLLDEPQNNLLIRSWDVSTDQEGSVCHSDPVMVTGRSKAEQNLLLSEAFSLGLRGSAGGCSAGPRGREEEGEQGGAGGAALCQAVAQVLRNSGVLACVKALQELDVWDIENIAPMYAQIAEAARHPDTDEAEGQQAMGAEGVGDLSSPSYDMQGGGSLGGGGGGRSAEAVPGKGNGEGEVADGGGSRCSHQPLGLSTAAGGAALPDESSWAECVDDFLLAQVLAMAHGTEARPARPQGRPVYLLPSAPSIFCLVPSLFPPIRLARARVPCDSVHGTRVSCLVS